VLLATFGLTVFVDLIAGIGVGFALAWAIAALEGKAAE
jgi:MFS superfamily sulfate permease-like transporter